MQLRQRLCLGSLTFSQGETWYEGPMFRSPNGDSCVRLETGSWFREALDEEKQDYIRIPVTDPACLEALEADYIREQSIETEWQAAAKERSCGNPLLETVIFSSLSYQNGYLVEEPCRVEGIDFWPVGRNASHNFSVGVKDGIEYVLAEGEDLDKYGNWKLQSTVRRVETPGNWGYVGHY